MIFEVGVEAFSEEIVAALDVSTLASEDAPEDDQVTAFERLQLALGHTRLLRRLFEDEPDVARSMRSEAIERVKTVHDLERYLRDTE